MIRNDLEILTILNHNPNILLHFPESDPSGRTLSVYFNFIIRKFHIRPTNSSHPLNNNRLLRPSPAPRTLASLNTHTLSRVPYQREIRHRRSQSRIMRLCNLFYELSCGWSRQLRRGKSNSLVVHSVVVAKAVLH